MVMYPYHAISISNFQPISFQRAEVHSGSIWGGGKPKKRTMDWVESERVDSRKQKARTGFYYRVALTVFLGMCDEKSYLKNRGRQVDRSARDQILRLYLDMEGAASTSGGMVTVIEGSSLISRTVLSLLWLVSSLYVIPVAMLTQTLYVVLPGSPFNCVA